MNDALHSAREPALNPASRPARRFRALATALFALFAGVGCARHIVLRVPHTELASSYECRVETGCTPATTDVPAHANRVGTHHLTLPSQCGRRIARIVIEEAGSSDPIVRVDCATPEEPIGETSRSP